MKKINISQKTAVKAHIDESWVTYSDKINNKKEAKLKKKQIKRKNKLKEKLVNRYFYFSISQMIKTILKEIFKNIQGFFSNLVVDFLLKIFSKTLSRVISIALSKLVLEFLFFQKGGMRYRPLIEIFTLNCQKTLIELLATHSIKKINKILKGKTKMMK